MRSADLVIIGAGVAGLTAAAVAAAEGIDVVVIEQLAPGGQIATVDNIRNFPGFPDGIGGHELGPLLQCQAADLGAAFLLDTVQGLECSNGAFTVHGAEGTVTARAVLLTTGSTRRRLGVPGEAEFEGRGVSHCASCDGQFFRGKTVVVAGGGDSGFDEAEILAQIAAEVVIIFQEAQPHAQQRTVERTTALPNIRLIPQSKIIAIEGNQEVCEVLIQQVGGTFRHPTSGVFVYAGLQPTTALAGRLVELDSGGAIIADCAFHTSVPGLFVAGDCRSGARALLASVAGDGAAAASAAVHFLRSEGGATA